jgi:DNA-binding transcriptional LysR family regulator
VWTRCSTSVDWSAGSDALGLAVLPMVRHELEAGILRVLPYRPPWLSTNYGFIARRGRTPSPAAEAFMDLVREIENEVDRVDADLEPALHAATRGPSDQPPRACSMAGPAG